MLIWVRKGSEKKNVPRLTAPTLLRVRLMPWSRELGRREWEGVDWMAEAGD